MAKILYVDVDGCRQEQVRHLLEGKGHCVVAAMSAERAMVHVEREHDYDAIVLHLMLRGMDGAELCRWLQRWSPLSSTPRVVFTTPDVHLNLDLDSHLPDWLPADVFLSAVPDMGEVANAVEKLLSSGSRARQHDA